MSTVPEFGEPQIASPDTAKNLFDGADTVTPDHTRSRKIPPGVAKSLGRLGSNKKARGGPRQLKPEDLAKIEDYYHMIAFGMMPIKPKVSAAITDVVDAEDNTRAHVCAEAWYKLAEQNDGVRRAILALIEGSAWSGVFVANMPILMAAMPEDALSTLFARFMPMPKVPDSVPEDWQTGEPGESGE